MKTFSTIAPLNRKTESYKEQGNKRPLVYRDSDHQKHHESLEATGDWCESVLVTLTNRPGAPVYVPEWLLKVWRRVLRRYDKKRPGETVPYHITANRGELGQEQASLPAKHVSQGGGIRGREKALPYALHKTIEPVVAKLTV